MEKYNYTFTEEELKKNACKVKGLKDIAKHRENLKQTTEPSRTQHGDSSKD